MLRDEPGAGGFLIVRIALTKASISCWVKLLAFLRTWSVPSAGAEKTGGGGAGAPHRQAGPHGQFGPHWGQAQTGAGPARNASSTRTDVPAGPGSVPFLGMTGYLSVRAVRL